MPEDMGYPASQGPDPDPTVAKVEQVLPESPVSGRKVEGYWQEINQSRADGFQVDPFRDLPNVSERRRSIVATSPRPERAFAELAAVLAPNAEPVRVGAVLATVADRLSMTEAHIVGAQPGRNTGLAALGPEIAKWDAAVDDSTEVTLSGELLEKAKSHWRNLESGRRLQVSEYRELVDGIEQFVRVAQWTADPDLDQFTSFESTPEGIQFGAAVSGTAPGTQHGRSLLRPLPVERLGTAASDRKLRLVARPDGEFQLEGVTDQPNLHESMARAGDGAPILRLRQPAPLVRVPDLDGRGVRRKAGGVSTDPAFSDGYSLVVAVPASRLAEDDARRVKMILAASGIEHRMEWLNREAGPEGGLLPVSFEMRSTEDLQAAWDVLLEGVELLNMDRPQIRAYGRLAHARHLWEVHYVDEAQRRVATLSTDGGKDHPFAVPVSVPRWSRPTEERSVGFERVGNEWTYNRAIRVQPPETGTISISPKSSNVFDVSQGTSSTTRALMELGGPVPLLTYGTTDALTPTQVSVTHSPEDGVSVTLPRFALATEEPSSTASPVIDPNLADRAALVLRLGKVTEPVEWRTED